MAEGLSRTCDLRSEGKASRSQPQPARDLVFSELRNCYGSQVKPLDLTNEKVNLPMKPPDHFTQTLLAQPDRSSI
jgi:hypothetical protein